jgi:hypothetical protein
MLLLRILPLLFCFSSLAQVNLIIEDATNTGFLLGINGYVQNNSPVKELAIQKLDTFPFDVRVELSPNVFFEKKMHFHNRGSYKYIITTNSRDELQLRYRGELNALPTGITAIDAKNTTPLRPLAALSSLNEKEKPTSVIQQTTAVTIEKVQPEITAATPKADKVKPIPTVEKVNAPKRTATVDSTLTVKKDSVSEPPPVPAPVKKEKTFKAFYVELEATEFEFEKLSAAQEFGQKHKYTLEEFKQVLAAMKYDNTRLEFMRAMRDNWKTIDGAASLRDSFEYEISKEQFNDLLF